MESATALFRPSGGPAIGRALIAGSGPGLAMSPEQGARSQVQAALDPELRGGEYLGPRWVVAGAPRREQAAANMRDHNSARILWELSEYRTGSLLQLV